MGNLNQKINDNDKAINNYQEAIKIYKTQFDKTGEASVLKSLANLYVKRSAHDKALAYFKESLQIFKSIQDKSGEIKVLNNMGIVYLYTGQYDKAISFLQESLLIKEKIGDQKMITSAYINIANVFVQQRDFDKAIIYYDKAKNLCIKSNNIAYIGVIYLNLGLVYMEKLNWDKAIKYNQKAEEIFIKIKDHYNLSSVYGNMGQILQKKKDYKKSIDYYTQSLAIDKQIKNKLGIAISTGNIASMYNELKQYNKAIVYADRSIVISKEIDALKEQMYAYKHLSNAYTGLEDYKKALNYKLLQTTTKDSLFSIEKTNKINEIQTKYETEKKELELEKKAVEITALEEEAKRNKVFLIATAIFLLLAIFLVVLIYQNRLMQSKYKAEQFNQKLLRLQMNPHFIFNTLTSIQAYMFEKDSKQAALYLSSFSKLTRAVLEGSRQEFVSLQEDYEYNENYLKIQQMRYENSFDYSINIDSEIDPEDILIAPMLIQPFIENSIKHGFKNISYQGHLQINYKKDADYLKISIEDNGKGTIDSEQTKTHQSHALNITKERLQILNKKSKKAISFLIINKDNRGYSVIFSIPIKHPNSNL
jgi:sensor histidine kinase YesM